MVILLLCSLIILFGYTFLFNNGFFYEFLGDAQRWYSVCRYVYECVQYFSFRMIAIVSGVFYDLLKKAPFLAVTRQGIQLFLRKGATIVEGGLYGLLIVTIGNRFMTLLRIDGERKEKKEGDEEEPETPEDTIMFNVSVIIICTMVLIIMFNFKSPWYLSKMFTRFFSFFA